MKSKGMGIQFIDNLDDGDLWDLKIKPVRGSDGKINSGFVIGETLNQNQAAILTAHQGEFKFMPALGVGLQDELLGEDLLSARHKIKEQYPIDGLTVKNLDLYKNEKFEISADYE